MFLLECSLWYLVLKCFPFCVPPPPTAPMRTPSSSGRPCVPVGSQHSSASLLLRSHSEHLSD